MRRVWFRSFLALLVLALSGTSAAAEISAVCARLKTQLENASSSSGSSEKYQRYAEAAQQQSVQINQVVADLSRFSCSSGSFIVMGGQNAKACAKLSAAYTKMRANLAKLERKRDAYADRGNKLAKRRIQAALDANDCDGNRSSIQAASLKGKMAALKAKSQRSPGLVAVIGNGDQADQGTTRARQTAARIVIEPKSYGGNYRTLCVRSCDGFFFPVSSTASPSDFGRDERTCQMMCPGTKTALYFHDALGQESEDMISARTREPYTEMPNAFAYRNASAPMSKACGCNMRAFYNEMQRREAILMGTNTGDEPVTTWVRPFNRPDPGEDPESVLNSEMRLTSEDIAAVLAASTAERPLTKDRQDVRVVGPIFLPDQSEHLDLKSGTNSLIR
ncbi:DUF2865 domain-containing protein [Hoeflea sp. AS60]|uniref:DUF2865 domain-containing protein n=1 Tax=Hoeflea sp. AS60 TaxID=3135780 RepID=UPI00317C1A67